MRVEDITFQLTPSQRATEGHSAYCMHLGFQLTPSQRATKNAQNFRGMCVFQLTPSQRATGSAPGTALWYLHFNSRPHRGRLSFMDCEHNVFTISTHALTEGDKQSILTKISRGNFNSRPHRGRRLCSRICRGN